jgi:type I restriction enzyme, R subunit
LNDERLLSLTHEIVRAIRGNVTLDWTKKDNARARLRTAVKRVLRQQGFSPEHQDKVLVFIMEQAEVIAREWAA